MKKLLTTLIILSMLTSNAYAYSFVNKEKEKATFKNKIEKHIAKKNAEREQKKLAKEDLKGVKEVIWKLNKYSNEHNVEELAKLYDKNYRSFDGFKYDTLVKMMQEAYDAYEDLSYKTDVEKIDFYGDKAVVNIVDTTRATVKGEKSYPEISTEYDLSTGYLEGICNYSIYLQKINNEWKIIGDNVISEITSIKYGIAREYPMEFSAPLSTPYGEDYCLTLKIKPKNGSRIVASLGKEEILYPSAEPKDVFRKMPKDGILERVVRANKDGYNEYAIASVGITKMDKVPEFNMIEIEMTGLAFLLQRVNMYHNINPIRKTEQNKKEDKKENAENKG